MLFGQEPPAFPQAAAKTHGAVSARA